MGEFELNLCPLQPQESWIKQMHKRNYKSETQNLSSAQQKPKHATFDNDFTSLPTALQWLLILPKEEDNYPHMTSWSLHGLTLSLPLLPTFLHFVTVLQEP